MDEHLQKSAQDTAAAGEQLEAGHDDIAGALVFDVRRAAAYEQADDMLPGARWRDPARLAQWAGELPRDRTVIVYCVHGHEVSQNAAKALNEAGVRARFLRGGIEGWKAAGRPLVDKAAG